MFRRRHETADAINNLAAAIFQLAKKSNEKVERLIMGLREDHDVLVGKFDTLETAVTAVAEDIAALKTELQEANDRANIDLSPLIARAEGIEAGLRAAVGSQPGSDIASMPTPTGPTGPTEPTV